MRAMGAHCGLSPVLDICRDPRWGRLEETFGEDPYLVTQMGVAFTRGLQGDDLADGVAATAKHFVGYGASEGGMNWAPAHLPERELRDVYLRPFEAAVRDASHRLGDERLPRARRRAVRANGWLLTDLLRGEWGFDGTVLSDYFSVAQLYEYHRVVESRIEAAAAALAAGLDVELPGTDCYGDALLEAVQGGLVTDEVLDEAVRRVLDGKFRLGLFERPLVTVDDVMDHTRTPAQIELAHRVASDSLVLLRNDGTLPLAPSAASIAVIGPNAADERNMVGDYAYVVHIESLQEVLEERPQRVLHPRRRGARRRRADRPRAHRDRRGRARAAPARARRHLRSAVATCGATTGPASTAAIAAAAAADVAIMVMGERSGLTQDCTSGESRDVAELRLPGVQEELVQAVAATGTPVVLVLVAGRPIGSPAVHEAAAAVLMAWLPGECGPAAIAEVLVGQVSPGGKLPDQLPPQLGADPRSSTPTRCPGDARTGTASTSTCRTSRSTRSATGSRTRRSSWRWTPLHGPEVRPGDVVTVSAILTNRGHRRADEVVQLYSRDPVASITRAVQELQGFVRVTLDPGRGGADHLRGARRGARLHRPGPGLRRRARRDRAHGRHVGRRGAGPPGMSSSSVTGRTW